MHVLWSTELLDFKRPSAVAVNSTWFIIQQLFGVDLVVLVDMDPGGSSCRKSAAVGLDPPPVPRSPLGPAASGNRLTRWARGEPLSFVGMMIHRKVKRQVASWRITDTFRRVPILETQLSSHSPTRSALPQKTRRSGQADPSPPTATLPPSTLKPCAGRHPSHHPSRHLPALVYPAAIARAGSSLHPS
ncbi:uncharacterized protein CIMG_01927 [Coccidioides immitis RS]|uniref:Uncharacterized protein n=1 Tax=Coccidioides immitis (strain RS) TaxID=246410 RepID=J3KK92_COCIM|nr:uncharacterized protein CIMG_01927 [Coccidioides immitis RS]EAS36573.3 hypothetical protein CIMG_01927 [Coccidioides immitis RS]